MLPAFQPVVPGSKQKGKSRARENGSVGEVLVHRHRNLRLTPGPRLKTKARCGGMQL